LQEFPEFSSGGGKYVCGICVQTFTRAKTLETHRRSHMKDIKKKKFGVNYNEFTFRVILNHNISNNTTTTTTTTSSSKITKYSVEFILN